MNEQTFKPFTDGTVSLEVSSASDRVAFTGRHNGSNLRLLYRNTDDPDALIFIKFGASDVVATADDIPFPANFCEIFGIPDGTTHVAAWSSDSPGGGTLYVTPGDGD